MSSDTESPKSQSSSLVEVENEPKMDEVHSDAEADLILISSDYVAFKVYKYHLISASPVFRHMLLSSGRSNGDTDAADKEDDRIVLTDTFFEVSGVVRLFLDLLQSNKWPEPTSNDIDYLFPLFSFLDKYERGLVRHAAFRVAYDILKSKSANISPHHLFILGSDMDDTHYCADAILMMVGKVWVSNTDDKGRKVDRWFWGSSGVKTVEAPPNGSNVMDPRFWDARELAAMQPLHLLALMRATTKYDLTSGTKMDWNGLADEFLRIMKTVK
nr:uncharacterized protein CI109_007225 [Kwoniella shandongensis]KAA5524433.1 hypothetical protein CI109_007225 [Kwoniella shandongensis]